MYRPSLKYTDSGTPVLSRVQIDDIAEEYIRDFRPEYLEELQPVDLDQFATEYLGLDQDFQYLSNCGIYLGMFVFSDTDKVEVYDPERNEARYISEKADTIVIDKSLLENGQERRYRFTMGHEIAHSIFHRPMKDPYTEYLRLFHDDFAYFRCNMSKRDFTSKPDTQWTDEQWREWQADAFASSILMPRSMMVKVASQAAVDPRTDIGRDFLIADTARAFDVSLGAAKIRLTTLGILTKEYDWRRDPSVPETVKRMREATLKRRDEHPEDEEILFRRDEDLMNNVEPGRRRTRRK